MLFLRATCYHISTCVTFGLHGNHSPVLTVCWGASAVLGLPQCLAQAQHADISTLASAPPSLNSTRTGRSNAPCSHIPHFYLRVSIIHSSAWRWVEIGATSQGPPLPTSTLHWSAASDWTFYQSLCLLNTHPYQSWAHDRTQDFETEKNQFLCFLPLCCVIPSL